MAPATKLLQAKRQQELMTQLKKEGHETLVHAQSVIREHVDQMLESGKSNRTIDRELKELANAGRIKPEDYFLLPSYNAIDTYRKHWMIERPIRKMMEAVPEVFKPAMEIYDDQEFDALRSMIKLAKDTERRYYKAVEFEDKTGIPLNNTTSLAMATHTILRTLLEYEAKLGIRKAFPESTKSPAVENAFSSENSNYILEQFDEDPDNAIDQLRLELDRIIKCQKKTRISALQPARPAIHAD